MIFSNAPFVGDQCLGKSGSPLRDAGDAPDVDAAATSAAWGIFYNQGEVCNAGSRLVVEASVKDEVVEKVMAVGRAMKLGDPLDPATEIGAMVDANQTERVMRHIEKGQEEGARLRLGGRRLDGDGCFIEPTLFDDVTSKMTIAQDEIFGPVLATIAAKDLDDAIRIGNDTRSRRPPRCGPASSRSIASTTAISPRLSAASSNPASAGTSLCTRSRNIPS